MRAISLSFLFAIPAFLIASPCDILISLTPPGTTIVSATTIAAGLLTIPSQRIALNVPAFCRVLAVARPSADSEIHFEVWLPPLDEWNGKFEGTGNGGFSGVMGYGRMAEALSRGYAAAGSDTGHDGGDLTFGVGRA